MAAVTICSDFGAQKNKDSHCFHCFPIYLPWSDGTRCMILVFWMLSFKPKKFFIFLIQKSESFTLLFHFHQEPIRWLFWDISLLSCWSASLIKSYSLPQHLVSHLTGLSWGEQSEHKLGNKRIIVHSWLMGVYSHVQQWYKHSKINLATSINITWRRKWQPTPAFLPRKFHGQRSLAGYSPRGHKESVSHDWVAEYTWTLPMNTDFIPTFLFLEIYPQRRCPQVKWCLCKVLR